MRISPHDLSQAQALVSQVQRLAAQVRGLDQQPGVDLEPAPDKVLLMEARVGDKSHVWAQASFAEDGLDQLLLADPEETLTFKRTHGFLGLGSERFVFQRLPTHGPREEVRLNPETGDLSYSTS